MTSTLPMFPLNTVLFPGMTIPLHVFEDRYRALVHHLLTIDDPAERLFGTVAIREGYEVGEHGAQSLYRVGVRLQLTEVEANPDGTFEIVATARDRIVLGDLEPAGDFTNGAVTESPDDPDTGPSELHDRVRAVFTAYRAAVSHMQGTTFSGTLPRDPEYLSWTLAALAPLPMAERQSLLEAKSPRARLELVAELLREELRAINVIPSLPATEVARTAWSPN
ncbi:LON peptidase substrate-binding domain-containing protein [Nocardioides piscis]|uniref:LON peptidase substrate-binding domain-containing protein n=1 Tax=Nocardioides piscis TaxID=2714938 RepID=A0A6G7YJ95_9ACTN|nr:LON peptidase substrate-binding domain-containing protein [Nocardioides piscis]QIK76810.1 LON peptidase substrate-binding domain-containing protein [Nocardioides piscis]